MWFRHMPYVVQHKIRILAQLPPIRKVLGQRESLRFIVQRSQTRIRKYSPKVKHRTNAQALQI